MAIPDDLFPLDATEALLDIKIGIDEDAWRILQYEFMRCVGHRYDHTYPTDDGWLVDAFNSFCKRLLTPDSEPEFLNTIVLLLSYLCRLRWEGLNEHKVKSILRNPMLAKRGELGLMKADGRIATTAASGIQPPVVPRSVAEQIDALRIESDFTIERLAALVNLEPRTVQRHIAGETTPNARLIFRYENAFSKALKRQVVISKLS